MANPEHLATLKEGSDSWNQLRRHFAEKQGKKGRGKRERLNLAESDLRGLSLMRLDLSDVDLTGAQLSNADLFEANLQRADLSSANLNNADLSAANLTSARLIDADLTTANMFQADLTHAILLRADLSGTNLNGAILRGTDFNHAHILSTLFADVDLASAENLASVVHKGPSTIGIDSIFRSKANVPEPFLRGAGVPDVFLTYARSLIGSGIEFYSCFISYSTRDQDFADRLYSDLRDQGVRCWFAPHDIQGGRKIHEQIDEAIRLHDKLLLILSPHSMKSNWVETEISKARKREVRDDTRVLFPVSLVPYEAIREWKCFDADIGKDSAREIREYFVPDFSNWKDHDAYKLAFDRLVRDLQAPAGNRLG